MLRMFIWLASATQLAIGVPLYVANSAGSGAVGTARALSVQPARSLISLASLPGGSEGAEILSPLPRSGATPGTLASAEVTLGSAEAKSNDPLFTTGAWLPGTVAVPDACSQYDSAIVVEDPSAALADLSTTNSEPSGETALAENETDLSQSLTAGEMSALCLQSAGSRFEPADETAQLRYGDQILLENRTRRVVRLGVGKNVMRVKVRF